MISAHACFASSVFRNLLLSLFSQLTQSATHLPHSRFRRQHRCHQTDRHHRHTWHSRSHFRNASTHPNLFAYLAKFSILLVHTSYPSDPLSGSNCLSFAIAHFTISSGTRTPQRRSRWSPQFLTLTSAHNEPDVRSLGHFRFRSAESLPIPPLPG